MVEVGSSEHDLASLHGETPKSLSSARGGWANAMAKDFQYLSVGWLDIWQMFMGETGETSNPLVWLQKRPAAMGALGCGAVVLCLVLSACHDDVLSAHFMIRHSQSHPFPCTCWNPMGRNAQSGWWTQPEFNGISCSIRRCVFLQLWGLPMVTQ